MLFFWLFIVVVLLLFEGFFSGSEMAFISVDPLKVRNNREIHYFIQHPDRLLITTLLGTNFCVVANSSILTYVLGKYFGIKEEYIAVAILSPLVLIFGETIPKSVARARPYAFTARISHIFASIYIVLSPLTKIFLKISQLFGQEGLSRDVRLSREALSLIIEKESVSEIEDTEKELIQRIMDLRNIRAREVMKPIVQVMALNESSTVEEAVIFAHKFGYTRFPVYRNHIYNIVGILNIFSLIEASLKDKISSYIQDAFFVPEFKNVWSVFLEMQEGKHPLCVVVDEFGAALGIITVEDILEEVFGEIEDEYDLSHSKGEKIVKLDDKTYVVSGDVELDMLEEVLKISLPKKDVYETVSGLLMYFMEKIPSRGEVIRIENVLFEVLESDGKRVLKVKMEKLNGQSR